MLGWLTGLAAAAGAGAAAIPAADAPIYGPPDAWVKPSPLPSAKAPDHPPAVQIVLSDAQTRYTAGARDSYAEVAIRIGTAEGLAAGTLNQVWDPLTQRLTINHVHILRDGKVIDALAGGRRFTVLRRETSLESAMLDGRLTANLQVEGLQVGDVLDVAVSVHDAQPILKDWSEGLASLAHTGSAQRIHLRETWPDARPMRWRTSADLAAPTLTHADGWSTLSYDQTDALTPPAPTGAPARYQIRGLIQVSQFQDWSQVSALMAPLYDRAARITPGSALDQAVKHIAATEADPRARALAALRLVQDQVRYFFVGLGADAYVPAAAELTWTRRFGDCKGKSALLLAVLRALGVQARPALASATANDGLDARLPMVADFDHVIVRAEIGGETYWLDGTRIGDRTLRDEAENNLRWALPIQAAGGKLERIAPAELKDPTDDRQVTLDISAGYDQPVRASAERTYRGDTAVAFNLVLQALAPTEQERFLRQTWAANYAWIDIGKVAWSFDPDRRTATLKMEGTGKAGWYGEAGQKYLDLDDSSLAWEASFRRDPGMDAAAPYAVAYPGFSRFHLTVLLPQHGRAFTLGNAADVDETVGGVIYHRTARIEAGRLEVEGSSRAVSPEFAAADATSAQAELQRLYNHDVSLGYSSAIDTASATSAAKAGAADHARGDNGVAEAASAAAEDMRRYDYSAAVTDFTRAMRLEPKAAKYVYDRGVAHYRAREDKLAAADFDAAITLDPGDTIARMTRGKLRLAAGDKVAAKADFDAALSSAPDKERVGLNIAGAYDNARDYSEMVATVDRWLAENPRSDRRYWALNLRCWARAEWGLDLDMALNDCNASLLLHQSADTLDSRALVELRLGRFDAAIADADAALKLKPSLSTSVYTRGLARLRKGQAVDGAADLKTAAALNTHTPQAFARLGLTP